MKHGLDPSVAAFHTGRAQSEEIGLQVPQGCLREGWWCLLAVVTVSSLLAPRGLETRAGVTTLALRSLRRG